MLEVIVDKFHKWISTGFLISKLQTPDLCYQYYSKLYYQYTNETPDDLVLEILIDEDHMPLSELKSDFKVKELIRKYFSDRYW